MTLFDINVLIAAHRPDHGDHDGVRPWLKELVESERSFALVDTSVAGFLRIVTNPRIHQRPTPLETALAFIDRLVDRPNYFPLAAGPRHWPIFRELLREADARGNLVPDAHLAAIAIEHGATIATRDRGFARFPGVRWLDPLADA